jgi:hypothetical protein
VICSHGATAGFVVDHAGSCKVEPIHEQPQVPYSTGIQTKISKNGIAPLLFVYKQTIDLPTVCATLATYCLC